MTLVVAVYVKLKSKSGEGYTQVFADDDTCNLGRV